MKIYLILLLTMMVIAQWAAPVSMVIEQEILLANGKAYKFKTEPIDPQDPFRGRYLTLRFAIAAYKIDSSAHYKENETVYVNLVTDKEGYAAIQGISKSKPADGDFVTAKAGYTSHDFLNVERQIRMTTNTLSIQYPFERFYLQEFKAKEADDKYRAANRDSTQISYGVVKVRKGEATIEDVIINGESVRDIVAKEIQKGN